MNFWFFSLPIQKRKEILLVFFIPFRKDSIKRVPAVSIFLLTNKNFLIWFFFGKLLDDVMIILRLINGLQAIKTFSSFPLGESWFAYRMRNKKTKVWLIFRLETLFCVVVFEVIDLTLEMDWNAVWLEFITHEFCQEALSC